MSLPAGSRAVAWLETGTASPYAELAHRRAGTRCGRCGGDTEMLAEPGERQALLVEPTTFGDVRLGQDAVTGRRTGRLDMSDDRCAVNASTDGRARWPSLPPGTARRPPKPPQPPICAASDGAIGRFERMAGHDQEQRESGADWRRCLGWITDPSAPLRRHLGGVTQLSCTK